MAEDRAGEADLVSDETQLNSEQETEWGDADPADTGEMKVDAIEQIGRFQIRRMLGSGGMSVVYDGFDPELHRRVAVKLLRTRGDAEHGTRDRDLIMREAQAMARLNHPNVITVYQVGEHDGQVYIAMELVEGETLRDWLMHEHRSRGEILNMFLQAGSGLQAAHEAGLIHRDFKPENVLVGREGRVRVLDFGLARGALDLVSTPETPAATASGEGGTGEGGNRLVKSLTRTGAVMGTPLYMAPEQHMLEPMDARVDQFSFCVALYEALYGIRPFPGETYAEFASNVINGMVRERPSHATVPEWLDRVIRRGLSRFPDERYETMERLLQDVITAQEFEEARAGRARAEVEGARAAVLREDFLEARAKIRGALEVEDSPAARALWWRLSRNPLKWVRRVGARIISLAATEDGRRLVAGGTDGCVHLLNVENLRTRVLRSGRGQVGSVAVASDGTIAAGSESGVVSVWQPGTTGGRPFEGHGGAVYGLIFLPGDHLLSSSWDGTLRIWDLETGKEIRRIDAHEGSVQGIAMAKDGTVASAGTDGTVRLWNLETGEQLACLEGHAKLEPRGFVAFSPDGNGLVSESEKDHTMRLWTRGRGGDWDLGGELEGHTDTVTHARWLADGRRIASVSYDGTLRIWDATAREAQRTYPTKGQLCGVAELEGARYLATGGEEIRQWDLVLADQSDPAEGHDLSVNSVRFSHNGARLFSGGEDGTVREWDIESGRQRRCIDVTTTTTSVAFSANDERLYVGQFDRPIRALDVEAGSEVLPLLGHDAAVSFIVPLDDEHMASTGWDGTVRIWNVEQGVETAKLGGGSWAFSLAANGDGSRVAQAGDGWIKLWNVESGEGEELDGVDQKILLGLVWHPERDVLAWGGDRGKVVLQDFESGSRTELGEPGCQLNRIAFSRDGEFVGGAYADGLTRMWDLERGTCLEFGKHAGTPFAFDVNHDGSLVATGSDDGTVRLWSAATGRPLWWGRLMTTDLVTLTHRGWERAGAPKGDDGCRWEQQVRTRAVLATASEESVWLFTGTSLECWDRLNDQLRGTWPLEDVRRLSVMGDWCFVQTGDRVFRWDESGPGWSTSGAIAWEVVGDELWIASPKRVVCFDPLGRQIVSFAGAPGVSAVSRVGGKLILGFEEGALEVSSSGEEDEEEATLSLEDHPPSRVRRILEGPMGTVIAAFDSGAVGLWSPADGKSLYRAKLHGAVDFLLYQGGYLHALTGLGDTLRLDLRAFEVPYPQLLRDVWREVPVVWREGLAVLEPPPKNHPLAP